MGSAVAICKKTGALLGGPVQTVKRLVAEGFDAKQVVNFGFGYMVGGGVQLDGVSVTATPAFHSSDSACALGNIVKAADGTTVYHAGDTAIFSEMAIYGRLYPMDLAIVPMGGVFTMDAYQAAEAVKMLSPMKAMPIHYASFPVLAKTADNFVRFCREKAPGVKVLAPAAGESVTI
jgi:L-ascorbate metabolism protein UlaG (beta-lactamase superfamily)